MPHHRDNLLYFEDLTPDYIRWCLNHGSDPNATTRHGKTALMDVAESNRHGSYRSAKILLRNGANPHILNDQGVNALYYACMQGNYDIAGLLLFYESNPNVNNPKGTTSLLWACLEGYTDIASLLLDNSADPNVVEFDTGLTPLIQAAKDGNIKLVKMLLKNGASTTIVDRNGRTAKRWAYKNGHHSIARML